MKILKALYTMKNGYDEVLFKEGELYEVSDEDNQRYWVMNEIGLETPIRIKKVENGEDFEEV